MSRASVELHPKAGINERGQILTLASFFVTLLSLLTWGLLSHLGKHTRTFLSDERLLHQDVAQQFKTASVLNALASNNVTLRRLFLNWIDIQTSGYSHVSNLVWSSLLWERNIPIPSPFDPLSRVKVMSTVLHSSVQRISQHNRELLNMLNGPVRKGLRQESLSTSLCSLLTARNNTPSTPAMSSSTPVISDPVCTLTLNRAVPAPRTYRQLNLSDVLPASIASSEGFIQFNFDRSFRGEEITQEITLPSRGNRALQDLAFVVHPRFCALSASRVVLPCKEAPAQRDSVARAKSAIAFEPHWSVHVVP